MIEELTRKRLRRKFGGKKSRECLVFSTALKPTRSHFPVCDGQFATRRFPSFSFHWFWVLRRAICSCPSSLFSSCIHEDFLPRDEDTFPHAFLYLFPLTSLDVPVSLVFSRHFRLPSIRKTKRVRTLITTKSKKEKKEREGKGNERHFPNNF